MKSSRKFQMRHPEEGKPCVVVIETDHSMVSYYTWDRNQFCILIKPKKYSASVALNSIKAISNWNSPFGSVGSKRHCFFTWVEGAEVEAALLTALSAVVPLGFSACTDFNRQAPGQELLLSLLAQSLPEIRRVAEISQELEQMRRRIVSVSNELSERLSEHLRLQLSRR